MPFNLCTVLAAICAGATMLRSKVGDRGSSNIIDHCANDASLLFFSFDERFVCCSVLWQQDRDFAKFLLSFFDVWWIVWSDQGGPTICDCDTNSYRCAVAIERKDFRHENSSFVVDVIFSSGRELGKFVAR